jgi:hypothetical protein
MPGTPHFLFFNVGTGVSDVHKGHRTFIKSSPRSIPIRRLEERGPKPGQNQIERCNAALVLAAIVQLSSSPSRHPSACRFYGNSSQASAAYICDNSHGLERTFVDVNEPRAASWRLPKVFDDRGRPKTCQLLPCGSWFQIPLWCLMRHT